MKYLLDTCVVSELVKKVPNQAVVSWVQSQNENNLYLSVLTLGEIEKGITKLQSSNKKTTLKLWLEEELMPRFKNRVIKVDAKVAIKWGALQAKSEIMGKPMPSIDGLIAVSGLVNNCIVVTRNISDMEQSQVKLLNPWLESK